MKNMQDLVKLRTNSLGGRRRPECFGRGDGKGVGIATRTERNRIHWPSRQELQRVSTTLAKVSRWGMRQEADGDYFNSGDVAYQLQEIIRATNELLKKSRRPRTPIRD